MHSNERLLVVNDQVPCIHLQDGLCLREVAGLGVGSGHFGTATGCYRPPPPRSPRLQSLLSARPC